MVWCVISLQELKIQYLHFLLMEQKTVVTFICRSWIIQTCFIVCAIWSIYARVGRYPDKEVLLRIIVNDYNSLKISMSDLGFHLFFILAVWAIVQMKQSLALKYGCGSFARNMMYGGKVPSDENLFIKSFAGLDKIHCFQNCHLERSCCVGVLHNREEMKCKLLKRYLTESDVDGTISGEEWEYFKITGLISFVLGI